MSTSYKHVIRTNINFGASKKDAKKFAEWATLKLRENLPEFDIFVEASNLESASPSGICILTPTMDISHQLIKKVDNLFDIWSSPL